MENRAIMYIGVAVAAVAAVAIVAYFIFAGKRAPTTPTPPETLEDRVKARLLEIWAEERQVNILVIDTDVRAIHEQVDLWNESKTEVLTTETTDDDGIAHFELAPHCTDPVITTEYIRQEINLVPGMDLIPFIDIVDYFLRMDIMDTGDIFHFKLQEFEDDDDPPLTWSSDYREWTEAIGNGNEYPDFDFSGVILRMTWEALTPPTTEMSETGLVELTFNIIGCTDDTQEFMFQVWRGQTLMGGGMTTDKKGSLHFQTTGSGKKGVIGEPTVHTISATSQNALWDGSKNFDVWQFNITEEGITDSQIIATTVRVRKEELPPNGDEPPAPRDDDEEPDDRPEPPPDRGGSVGFGDHFRVIMGMT